MIAARQIANRWYGKMAGIALIAFGIAVTSVPAPTGAIHGLEDKAVSELAPILSNTEIGRQLIAVYVARDAQCHREL